jgi:hypothetical protein
MRCPSRLRLIPATLLVGGIGYVLSTFAAIPDGYTGTPFHDDSVKVYPIKIPGKVQCEYYDFGGKGVAFDGTVPLNNGINEGAHLNGPPPGYSCNEGGIPYQCTFRAKEDVPVSYTKPSFDIDGNLNKYIQVLHQMYIGWTPPGEWLNYTVHVDTPAIYSVNLMYTAPFPKGCDISLALNKKTLVNKATVPNSSKTGSQTDGNRWHRWNKAEGFAEITLPDTGLQLLTLTITYSDPTLNEQLGNFDYLEFVRKGPVSVQPSLNKQSPASFRLSVPETVSNKSAQVSFSLTSAGQTTLAIFDCAGNRVMQNAKENLAVGIYNRTLDLSSLSNGVYFLQLSQGAKKATSKLTVYRR